MATQNIIEILFFIPFLLFGPSLAIGIIRKAKARLQTRVGAPIHQPLLDLLKLLRKGETVSETASWVFRASPLIIATVTILIAGCVPWLSFKPQMPGCDLFLIIYLFVLVRFMSVIAALDAGSAFGGFASSREVTLALLVEPGIVLCLTALCCMAQRTDLTMVFSYQAGTPLFSQSGLWIFAGLGLFLASLVELSRMPADDPTTHLELTMVHEAMILENSGRNLALIEYAHGLKLIILMGVSVQCFLHAIPAVWTASELVRGLLSVAGLILSLLTIAVIEATAVKLRWTKVPEFIAYAVALSFICVFIAAGR